MTSTNVRAQVARYYGQSLSMSIPSGVRDPRIAPRAAFDDARPSFWEDSLRAWPRNHQSLLKLSFASDTGRQAQALTFQGHVQQDGKDKDHALQHVLVERMYPQQIQAIVEHSHN